MPPELVNRCRGCLSNDSENYQSLQEVDISALFYNCTRIEIDADRDGMPRFICGICYQKCVAWNRFFTQCQETNALLQTRLCFESQEYSATNGGINAVVILERNSAVSKGTDDDDRTVPSDLLEFEEEILHEDIVDELEETVDDQQHYEDEHLSECDLENDEAIDENQVDASPPTDSDPDQQNKNTKKDTCQECSAEFNSRRALWRHMNKHSDARKYECQDCGKTYKFSSSLTQHRKTHQDVRQHVCDLCGKAFYRHHGLRSHMLTHTLEKPFECKLCSKSFKNETMLRNHVARHEKVMRFFCAECSKGFLTAAELATHGRSHSDERAYACTICEKRYKTSSQLTVHLRTHTGETPYKCSICQSAYRHIKSLKNHMLIHSGEMQWSCDLCQKTFRLRDTMVKHRKIHSRKATARAEDSEVASQELPDILPSSFVCYN